MFAKRLSAQEVLMKFKTTKFDKILLMINLLSSFVGAHLNDMYKYKVVKCGTSNKTTLI